MPAIKLADLTDELVPLSIAQVKLRSDLLGRLGALLDSLEQNTVNVADERRWLEILNRRIAEAETIAAQLGSARRGTQLVSGLKKLQALLSGSDWEFTERLVSAKTQQLEGLQCQQLGELQIQNQAQQRSVDLLKQALVWLDAISRLELKVSEGSAQRAAVSKQLAKQRKERWKFDSFKRNLISLVSETTNATSDSTTNENRLRQLQALDESEKPEDRAPTIQDWMKEVEEQIEAVRPASQQGGITIIRSSFDDKAVAFDYTVLLRTPGKLGEQGIHIQDQSTVAKQDRDWIVDEISRLMVGPVRLSNPRSEPPIQPTDGRTENANVAPAIQPSSEANSTAASTTPDTMPATETDTTGTVNTPATTTAPGGNTEAAGVPTAGAAVLVANGRQPAQDVRRDSGEADFAQDTIGIGGYDAMSVREKLERIGDLMYRIFIPDQMQRYLAENPCALTLTTNDHALPWELMCYQKARYGVSSNTPSDGATLTVPANQDFSFLCLESPLARVSMGEAFPQRSLPRKKPDSDTRFLLVSSNPRGDLKQIDNEIKAILAEVSKPGVECTVLSGEKAQGRQLNWELRSGKYDVIHYAGHASFDRNNPHKSGLVLKDGEIFYAQKIRRLLVGRPVVFLNACQTGRTANEQELRNEIKGLQGPAEGLASAFIYGGARSCIGSLWPVYDDFAASFAIEFYKELLNGAMVGVAMQKARIKMRKDNPSGTAWGTFVLYGDPTFNLQALS